MKGPILHVSAEAERMLRFGHPWLYDRAISRQRGKGKTGDLATIYDRRDRFLALGLYDARSPIRVRVLQRMKPAVIDEAWFRQRMAQAFARREPIRKDPQRTTGYRLIHGENDDLPGLILDRYADTLVLKLYTAAWASQLAAVVSAISAEWPESRLVLRLARNVDVKQAAPVRLAQGALADGSTLIGEPPKGAIRFEERGLLFEADPVRGHKTGFFLDQRENRALAESLSRGKEVLDVFAYTGAFAIAAARGGARAVLGVDVNAHALQVARRHVRLNQGISGVAKAKFAWTEGDAFAVLDAMTRRRQQFGLVLVDPPSFAKSMADVTVALAAYEKLTALALGLVARGGAVMVSSCSSQVDADAFYRSVTRVVRGSGKRMEEIARTAHPVDHPVGFPEGSYLKGWFARRAG